jgi:hypothetical protein
MESSNWKYESALSRKFESWDTDTQKAYLDEHRLIIIKSRDGNTDDHRTEMQMHIESEFYTKLLSMAPDDNNKSDDEKISDVISESLRLAIGNFNGKT